MECCVHTINVLFSWSLPCPIHSHLIACRNVDTGVGIIAGCTLPLPVEVERANGELQKTWHYLVMHTNTNEQAFSWRLHH